MNTPVANPAQDTDACSATSPDLKGLMLSPSPLTLAVAESLTCGRLQARIGQISGASRFFVGGMTAYALDQKVKHLGVNRAEAEAVNSVSATVALSMAKGVCTLFGSDLGVSTTGYAEPSIDWKVDHPFAWWAIAHRLPSGDFALRHERVDVMHASRTEVQEAVAGAAEVALMNYLRELRGYPVAAGQVNVF